MHYVKCKVSLGFFETEFYVVVNDSSAYVNRRSVEVQILPTRHREVDGLVLVHVVTEQGDNVLVELPGEPVVGGLRTWVPKTDLKVATAVA